MVLSVSVVAFLLLHVAHGQGFGGSQISGIRLINSDGSTGGNQGRVEVLYNGTWGTICDDSWSYNDAQVACRMLGFDDAVCYPDSARFGRGNSSLPIWMDDLQCYGNEAALDLCFFPGWGEHDCAHHEDAGVVCSNVQDIGIPSDIQLLASNTASLTISWTAPERPDGILKTSIGYKIRYESESRFLGTFSYSNSSHLEGQQLSYTLTGLSRGHEYGVEVSMRISYSVCQYNYIYGNYSDPVFFRTNATFKQSNIPVRLISTYGYPGLKYLGRVEVLHNNLWGTICDNSFGSTDADVVCQTLNFTRGALCHSTSFGRGTGRIWMDNVNCGAGDEVLEDCDFDGWGVHNCDHSEDIGVVCNPSDQLPPVKNLTVTNVGPTYFTVHWNAYNFGRVHRIGYEIRYTDSYGHSQTRTVSTWSWNSLGSHYRFYSLNFGEVYTVSVRVWFLAISSCSTYVRGEYSNPVSVQTMTTAPSSAPTDFRVSAINSTSIEVFWELPAPYFSHGGIIRGFKLFVTPANGGSEMTINIRDNSTDVYAVSGLTAATSYRFSVLAYNSAGDGPRSIALTIATLSFDPLITEFGYNGNGLDKATLHPFIQYILYGGVNILCTSRNTTHAPADWYYANGTRIGVRDRDFRAVHFPNGTAMLQIAHYRRLSYCDGGNYTCIINTTSGHYETRTFNLVVDTTPPTPGQPFEVIARSTSITIGWSESSCDGGHPIISFDIGYERQFGNFPAQIIRNIDPTRRNYTITGLQSSTFYSFSVRVVTVNSRTSSFSSSVAISTLAPAPSAPRDVTVRLVTPSMAEVRWRVPAVTNGVITRYIVYAIPQGGATRQRRQDVAVSTPQTIRTEFPGTATAGNITLTHHSISYQFQVSAATMDGQTLNEGDRSPVTANTTLFVPEPGLPTPSNVRVTGSTNSSVSLAWDYPPPPSLAIQSFLISYSANVEYRSPQGDLVLFEDSGNVMATISSTIIRGLVPESRYQFQVSAVTTSGRGAEVSVSGRTRLAHDNILAYIQVRMEPVQSCIEYADLTEGSNKDNLINIRNGLAEELSHLCQTCGPITAANIKDDEFSCRGGLTKQIVYRARIVGTDTYSAPGLVSFMQSWVSSGRAFIMVQSSRLHLDPTCDTSLDTLDAPDCEFFPPHLTTNPTNSLTNPTTGSPSINSLSGNSGGGVSVGEIGVLAVGGVIIILLAILIVLIAVVIMSRRRSKLSFNNEHEQMNEADHYSESPFADPGSRDNDMFDGIDNKDETNTDL